MIFFIFLLFTRQYYLISDKKKWTKKRTAVFREAYEYYDSGLALIRLSANLSDVDNRTFSTKIIVNSKHPLSRLCMMDHL